MSQKGRNATRMFEESNDDKATEYLYQHLFILPLVGGVFAFRQTRWWSTLTYFVFTLFYVSVISTIVTVSYASYLNRDNTSVLSGCLHISITGFVVLGASTTLQYGRRDLIEIIVHYILEQNVCEYQSGKYFSSLLKNTDKKIRSLLFFWLFLYGCVAMVSGIQSKPEIVSNGLDINHRWDQQTAVVCPFVDTYLGYELTLNNITDVYWKGLPFTLWWPMDADNSYFAWITCFMSQGVYAFFGGGTAATGMLVYAMISENIFNHIKLLVHSLGHLDERARAMMAIMHPGKAPKNFREEYDECYYACIVQNVKHYNKILLNKDLLMQLASIPIAVPFFGGALLLGLAGILLLSHDDPRIGPKVFFGCLGMTEAIQMFLLCRYGEQFQILSEELFNATFYTSCYRRSMKCKKAMIIFRYGCTKPMTMTAAKLIVLNMETFANLVNSAYSIFNLQSVTASGDK